jgi:cyclopropane-fatty-acyl-phospholipid synthase
VNRLERRLEHALATRLEGWTEGSLQLDLPEGGRLRFGRGEPVVALRIESPRFYRRVALAAQTGLCESYLAGEWSSPDLAALLAAGLRNLPRIGLRPGRLALPLRLLDRLRHALRSNTRRGSERNVHAHYDLGNDFFRLFLDESLAYSCGIFRDPAHSLEQAQLEKYRTVARKLELARDHHVLEIGTGWGGLALHLARESGCRVTTITVSHEQHAFAREQVRREGLEDRIDARYCDYRDVEGRFDRVVSIEMLEAVGRRYWSGYFETIERALCPGGRALVQVILIPDHRFASYRRGNDFIQKYVFPGGMLPSLFELAKAARRAGRLELRDVEEIGPHYAPTLRHWRDRFEKSLPAVRALGKDDRFLRLWRFYLASCEAAFATGHVRDAQLLFSV